MGLYLLTIIYIKLYTTFLQHSKFTSSLAKLRASLDPASRILIKPEDDLKWHAALRIFAWQSVFSVEGISDSTADEGLQLMGSDVDESPGYKVVNRDWPLAPPGKFASVGFATGGLLE